MPNPDARVGPPAPRITQDAVRAATDPRETLQRGLDGLVEAGEADLDCLAAAAGRRR